MNQKDWTSQLEDKITFPPWRTLLPSHMPGWWHSRPPGCRSSLCDSPFLLRSMYMSWPTRNTQVDASPSSPGLGSIPKDCSAPPWAVSEETGNPNEGLGGKELEINLGCHQVYRCASPLHLGGRTGRREWGACAGEGQTKSEWGREASVESPSAAPARAGRDASVERSHSCRCSFFPLLQMGAGGSRTTPLKCILKTGTFDPQCLKRHAWSCSVILNGHGILWKMGKAGLLKGLSYNTAL